jgi:hypothetical protein
MQFSPPTYYLLLESYILIVTLSSYTPNHTDAKYMH